MKKKTKSKEEQVMIDSGAKYEWRRMKKNGKYTIPKRIIKNCIMVPIMIGDSNE